MLWTHETDNAENHAQGVILRGTELQCGLPALAHQLIGKEWVPEMRLWGR